jgi:hypothetical protein
VLDVDQALKVLRADDMTGNMLGCKGSMLQRKLLNRWDRQFKQNNNIHKNVYGLCRSHQASGCWNYRIVYGNFTCCIHNRVRCFVSPAVACSANCSKGGVANSNERR